MIYADIDEIIDSSHDDYLENDFQEMRNKYYESEHNFFQKFFNQWCKESGVKVVAYNHNYPVSKEHGKLTIYTTRPGCMIGYKGTLVNKYKEILEKEFYGKYDIKFEEIQGEFIIVEEKTK